MPTDASTKVAVWHSSEGEQIQGPQWFTTSNRTRATWICFTTSTTCNAFAGPATQDTSNQSKAEDMTRPLAMMVGQSIPIIRARDGGVGQISMGAMAEPAFVAYVFRVYGKN